MGSVRNPIRAASARTRASVAVETRWPRSAYDTPAWDRPVAAARSRRVARLRLVERIRHNAVNRFTQIREPQMDATTKAALARWFGERLPASGAIEPAAMLALAEQLAARSDLWDAFVRHDEQSRVYTRIHCDPVLDAWLICWSGTQDTGLHDHDLSSGAVRVVAGELAEDRLVLGAPGLVTSTHAAAQGFCFDSSRIHDVRNARVGRVGVAPSLLAAAGADGLLRDRHGRVHRPAERAGIGGAAGARRRLSLQAARVPQMIDAAAEAEPARADLLHPGRGPPAEHLVQGMLAPEPLDAWARGTGRCGSTPGRRGRRTSGRPTRVQSRHAGSAAPRGTPNSSDAIIPPGRTAAASAAQRRRRVVHVAQQVGVGQRVDRAVGDRQALGLRPRTSSIRSVSPGRRRPGARRRRACRGSGRRPTTRHG